MINTKVKAWIHAARLRTLPLAMSGILLASLISYSQGVFKPDVCILATITTLLLQILSNFANDYGDYTHGTDNEKRVGPKRAVQSGVISPGAMKKAMYVIGLLAFHSGMFLLIAALDDILSYVFILFLITGLVAIGSAIKYTVGKKNYGYKGFGDLMVFMFFGIAAVFGTHFLHALEFDWLVLLPATSIGLLSTGVLNVNNMRDIENDPSTGKITLAVRLGKTKSKTYQSLLVMVSILLIITYLLLIDKKLLALSFIMPSVILILHLFKIYNTDQQKDLDPELKRLSLTTLLVSLWVGIGIII